MHEPSYIAGLIDGHYLSHTGRELRLRYDIGWQLVEVIADYLEGTWTAKRKPGPSKNLRMFSIRFSNAEKWSEVAKITRAINN